MHTSTEWSIKTWMRVSCDCGAGPREFGEVWKGRFEIHMLDRFAADLLEV